MKSNKWSPLKGFESMYVINRLGEIKNIKRNRKLKPYSKYQYQRINLRNSEGKSSIQYIHRLVAQTFIINDSNKECVNHKNGNKHDNRVSNLEWVSYGENAKHAYDNGLFPFCKVHDLTPDDVAEMKRLKRSGKTYREIASMYGISNSYPWFIINGKSLLNKSK